MIALVLKNFRDRETGEIRKAGETFECTDERFEEITNAADGYVEAVEEPADEQTEEPAEEPAPKKTTRKTAAKKSR